MPKLVLLITPYIEKAYALGDAWDQAGAPGVTYMASHGFHTLRQSGKAGSIPPGMMSLFEIMRNSNQNSITMFSVVPDDTTANRLVAATEDLLGDLTMPDNGILFVIDVERAVGLRQPG